MIESVLNAIFVNQFTVLLFCVGLLLIAADLGFRLGLRLHLSRDEARKGQIGGIQGAVLGLLGLLLGFTFAMAAGRYETRRDLVVQEANAIGTTYLRASLLPDSYRAPVEDGLRRYVDVRIDFYEAGEDDQRLAAAEQESAALQKEIWNTAIAAAKEAPSPLTASFITSLNETIDLDATRMNALRSHVPGAVWLLVLGVATCGCCASGYAAGSSGVRNGFSNLVMPILVAIVVALIADLDRPRGGLIGIKQQALLDLRETIGGRAMDQQED